MRDDERARILADLDHLLNAPVLQAMRRCDAALQKKAPTREDVMLIRALCARMWSHLTTFRAFSRLASNEPIRPNVAPLSVDEFATVFQTAVQDASALTRHRSHQIKLSIEADRDLVIEVDLNLLEMVLRQVIDNAVKYTSNHGLIQILLKRGQDNTLALSVMNESPLTLSPEEIKSLFERGYRGRHAALTTTSGDGIGLFLVQAVMQSQNGDVRIEYDSRLFRIVLAFPINLSRDQEA